MSSNFIAIPCYSLSPKSITLYEEVTRGDGTHFSNEGWENLNDNKNYYGELSEHSRKRLKRKIDYMLYLSKERQVSGSRTISKTQNFTTDYEKGEKYMKPVKSKLTFITLTLPSKQEHSDNEIKSKCLNPFLNDLRRKFKVDMYIWKAEKQENGNIHFHVLINRYIHWSKVRESWNRKVEILGYISGYQKTMKEFFKNGFRMSENTNDKRSRAAQFKAYETGKAENWKNPNSTDIHALYKVRNAAAYLSKYLAKDVTKSDRTEKIETLKIQKNEIKKKIDEITQKLYLFDDENPESKRLSAKLRETTEQLENIKNSLSDLAKLGVTGRIWGCSSKLSKCSNFSTSENWYDIPGIEKVQAISDYVFETKVGNRSITTYCININDFPILKANLDFHLNSLI